MASRILDLERMRKLSSALTLALAAARQFQRETPSLFGKDVIDGVIQPLAEAVRTADHEVAYHSGETLIRTVTVNVRHGAV